MSAMGWALMLGSFQCQGVLLRAVLHMVGQGLAVLQQVRHGWVVFFIYFFISPILSSLSNASSVGRRLDILKYCGLGRYNPAIVTTGGVLAKYWLTLSRSRLAQVQC